MRGAMGRYLGLMLSLSCLVLLFGAPAAVRAQSTSGSLCVTITPPTAVDLGAQWRRQGTTTWRASGTTETQVPAGNHTLEFSPVAGWDGPAGQQVTILAGLATQVTAPFTQVTGSLFVTITPPEAVAAGAKWRRLGTTQWFDSGTTETGVPVCISNSISVEFKPVAGWTAPSTVAGLWISRNTTTFLSRAYTLQTGSLNVACLPSLAASAGAQWRRVGTLAWLGSGTSERNLPIGDYTVEFKAIAGWDTPTTLTAKVQYNQTTYKSGTYLRQQGALLVTISPPEAAAAGAKWRRVGTTSWQASGTSETLVPTGDYQVEGYSCGSGWSPDPPAAATVRPNQMTELTLSYHPTTADLSWSTYLGGTGSEIVYGIAMDGAGYLYVTGSTTSANWATGGCDTTLNGTTDAFVAKLSPVAGEPVWSTYLGGSLREEGRTIALDKDGNIIVGGATQSTGWISGGYCTQFTIGNNTYNPYVAKLSPQGELLWSTYLGTDGGATAVAADGSGNIGVTGFTGINGLPMTYNTVFVKKLSPAGKLLWSNSYTGAYRHASIGNGLAIDGQGNLIVVGTVGPVDWIAGGYDTTFHGGTSDAFLMKLSPLGHHLWSTYLGGAATDYGNAVAVDHSGAICVTGSTLSAGWISGGYNTALSGNGAYYDGFVVRLTAAGQPVWGTYLGSGNGADRGMAVAMDAAGNAYIAGETSSTGWISGDIKNSAAGMTDAFVIKLSLAGRPLWSTCLGSFFEEYCNGIALDGAGNLGVVGGTTLGYWAVGGYDTQYDQVTQDYSIMSGDGFVARIHDNNMADPATGSLRVTLNPPAAAGAGVQWRRVGTTAWHGSGILESGVPAGPCRIEFKAAACWVPPADLATTVTSGQTLDTSVTFTWGASLKVNIAPPEAAAAGAQWRREGTFNLFNGGETEAGVPATSQTLEFLAAPGWIPPVRRALTLAAGQTSETTATYMKAASLCVTIDPPLALTYATCWRRAGMTDWHASGTTETDIAPGPHTVEFLGVPYFTKPAPIPVTLGEGDRATLSATYTRQSGDLKVVLLPAEAEVAGAQWRRVGTTAWLGSGETETSIPAGPYTLEFKPIGNGWVTPANKTVAVSGYKTTVTVVYGGNGSLQVTLAPPEAVAAGAQWRRVGTTPWLGSGAMETTVSAGVNAVEFKPVGSYWITPATQNVTVLKDQLAATSATYTPGGALNVMIDPPEAVAAGAKWRRVGTTTWLDGGTTETHLRPGAAGVEFLAPTGWMQPASQSVTIAPFQTTRAGAWFLRPTDGSLRVTINPPEAAAAGAQWRRTGTTAWRDSGATDIGLVAGKYVVEFRPLPMDWIAPTTQSVNIAASQAVATSATYAPTQSDMIWSTYLGGTGKDLGQGVATDRQGNIYVSGYFATDNWPAGGYEKIYKDTVTPAASVIKLTSSGQVLWCSYLGLGIDDNFSVSKLTLDAAGNVYLAGVTRTAGWVSGGYNTHWGGSQEGFVAKLSPQGRHLWSTYVGYYYSVTDLTVDQAGNIFVVGNALSSYPWPDGGCLTALHGRQDAYVAKLAPDGGRPLWSTYLGGSNDDSASGIAVDNSGNVFVCGSTCSSGWPSGGYRTLYDTHLGNLSEGFLAKLAPDGRQLWSTYIGGIQGDYCADVAVDSLGNATVVGSSDTGEWLPDGPAESLTNGFALRFTTSGQLCWSTCFSGVGQTTPYRLCLDADGNAIVMGITNTSGWLLRGYDTQKKGIALNGFAIKLSASGRQLWGSYVGGDWVDYAYDITTDGTGNIYVTGFSDSDGWVAGGFDTVRNSQDGFLVKIHDNRLPGPVGALRVTIPSSPGAKWRRLGTLAWFASGAVETGVPCGNYWLEVKDAAGHVTLTQTGMTVAQGLTTQINAPAVGRCAVDGAGWNLY